MIGLQESLKYFLKYRHNTLTYFLATRSDAVRSTACTLNGRHGERSVSAMHQRAGMKEKGRCVSDSARSRGQPCVGDTVRGSLWITGKGFNHDAILKMWTTLFMDHKDLIYLHLFTDCLWRFLFSCWN